MSTPTPLRANSEPLRDAASSQSSFAKHPIRRPFDLQRAVTFAARGNRSWQDYGKALEAKLSLVVVYAVFATCANDDSLEDEVGHPSDGADDPTTRPSTSTNGSAASSLPKFSPHVLPSLTRSSSPASTSHPPPSSPSSAPPRRIPTLLDPSSLTAIGLDLARCRLRACTCSPDYESDETTSSDDEEES